MSEDKECTTLLSGHKAVPFDEEEAAKYSAKWQGYTMGMIRVQPGGTILPAPFPLFHDRIMKFNFSSSDVVVLTFPKCGTTWTQEIVWTLRNNPDLENPAALAPVNFRCPFLELDVLSLSEYIKPPGPDHPLMLAFKEQCPDGDPSKGVFLQLGETAKAPRTVKTHLPFSLLPKDLLEKSKVVYVIRNPKDQIVSFLHHCRLFMNHNFVGSIEDFVQNFVDGDLLYGHYDRHLKEAMERKDHPNFHLIHFEDMKEDPMKELKRLNEFLGTERTEDQLIKIAHYTSFSEMKKRDNVIDPNDESGFFNPEILKNDGGFFRKGIAGDWKEKLSPELSAKVDKWVAEKLADTPVDFRYNV